MKHFWSLLFRAQVFTFLFLVLFFVLTMVVICIFSLGYLHNFSIQTHVDARTTLNMLKSSWQLSKNNTQNFQTILVLGTDALAERSSAGILTDSIMLIKIDYQRGMISLLSLPRDIWHQGYQTKINALLSYGDQFYSNHPEQFVSETLSKFLGVKIDDCVVLSLETVANLVEIAGGVEVEVKEGFEDEKFPREGVDPSTTKDPTILYKTVSFQAGKQTFDKVRALEYIRSRNSKNNIQGNDNARGERQQQVLQALFAKLIAPQFLTNSANLAKIYNLYMEQFSQYINLDTAISYLIKLSPKLKHLSFQRLSIPIYPDQSDGIIFHPNPKLFADQWVYQEVFPGALSEFTPKILSL